MSAVELSSGSGVHQFEDLSKDPRGEPSTLANSHNSGSADIHTRNMNGKDRKNMLKSSVHDVASIPNGGSRAWLQVVGGFCLFFNTWGIVNTFGAYQSYYETGALFSEKSTTISWIGSVQVFFLLLVGALTGPIYDAGHFRSLLICGSFMVVFGQMMLSICKNFWQVLLAQGFCMGIGTGMLFVPSVAIISTYFTSKLAFAIGVAASGSGLGGVIYPIVLHRLQPRIGFGWATRTLGFIELATLLLPICLMQVRVLPAKARRLVDWSALHDLPYCCFILGSFVGYMGLFVPFFYLSYFAIQKKITDENLGAYIIPILSSASIFGRLVPNFLADRLGVLNTMIPCAFVTAILVFCLISVDSLAGIVIITLLYGFFSGAYVSLPPTIIVHLTSDRALIGTRLGQGFAVIAFGVLTGAPVAGAILGQDSWMHTWVFGGTLLMAAALLFLVTRSVKGGYRITSKV